MRTAKPLNPRKVAHRSAGMPRAVHTLLTGRSLSPSPATLPEEVAQRPSRRDRSHPTLVEVRRRPRLSLETPPHPYPSSMGATTKRRTVWGIAIVLALAVLFLVFQRGEPGTAPQIVWAARSQEGPRLQRDPSSVRLLLYGIAPDSRARSRPPAKAAIVGIPRMRYFAPACGWSSVLSFTSRACPERSCAAC